MRRIVHSFKKIGTYDEEGRVSRIAHYVFTIKNLKIDGVEKWKISNFLRAVKKGENVH